MFPMRAFEISHTCPAVMFICTVNLACGFTCIAFGESAGHRLLRSDESFMQGLSKDAKGEFESLALPYGICTQCTGCARKRNVLVENATQAFQGCTCKHTCTGFGAGADLFPDFIRS